MEKPVVADNQPTVVSLKKGETYYFCACGRSSNQPFCDGSHQGTAFTPQAFVAEKDGNAYLCACKHSDKAPFCDGSHQRFADDQVGREAP